MQSVQLYMARFHGLSKHSAKRLFVRFYLKMLIENVTIYCNSIHSSLQLLLFSSRTTTVAAALSVDSECIVARLAQPSIFVSIYRSDSIQICRVCMDAVFAYHYIFRHVCFSCLSLLFSRGKDSTTL